MGDTSLNHISILIWKPYILLYRYLGPFGNLNGTLTERVSPLGVVALHRRVLTKAS